MAVSYFFTWAAYYFPYSHKVSHTCETRFLVDIRRVLIVRPRNFKPYTLSREEALHAEWKNSPYKSRVFILLGKNQQ